jgi:hypothetical protein
MQLYITPGPSSPPPIPIATYGADFPLELTREKVAVIDLLVHYSESVSGPQTRRLTQFMRPI